MLNQLLTKYPALESSREAIAATVILLISVFERGNKLLACGNGGSAADCEHIVGELMKGFTRRRPVPENDRTRFSQFGPEGEYLCANLQKPLPAISLVSSVSLSTAFANDVAADLVFAQQVYGLGRPGDVLIALSTSGSSRNVVHAVRTARALDMHTVGLTGGSGGLLKDLCEITIAPAVDCTPDIQELHLPIYHYICKAVEQHFFDK